MRLLAQFRSTFLQCARWPHEQDPCLGVAPSGADHSGCGRHTAGCKAQPKFAACAVNLKAGLLAHCWHRYRAEMCYRRFQCNLKGHTHAFKMLPPWLQIMAAVAGAAQAIRDSHDPAGNAPSSGWPADSAAALPISSGQGTLGHSSADQQQQYGALRPQAGVFLRTEISILRLSRSQCNPTVLHQVCKPWRSRQPQNRRISPSLQESERGAPNCEWLASLQVASGRSHGRPQTIGRSS